MWFVVFQHYKVKVGVSMTETDFIIELCRFFISGVTIGYVMTAGFWAVAVCINILKSLLKG